MSNASGYLSGCDNTTGQYQKMGYANVQTPTTLGLKESNSPIRDGIITTEDKLNQLHNVISELEKRFDAVLVPNVPTPAGTGQNEKSPSVQADVTVKIRTNNYVLADAISRLVSIIQRAEV